jgi:hypothetical protein
MQEARRSAAERCDERTPLHRLDRHTTPQRANLPDGYSNMPETSKGGALGRTRSGLGSVRALTAQLHDVRTYPAIGHHGGRS